MTGSPSICVIRSPLWKPARAAGVSSIGEMTLTSPFSSVTSMPKPPNSPRVWTCISAKSSVSRKLECGSSEVSMPLMAALTSCSSVTFSTYCPRTRSNTSLNRLSARSSIADCCAAAVLGALDEELAAAWMGAPEAGGWASAGRGARSASDTANSAEVLVADFRSFMRARSSGGHEPKGELSKFKRMVRRIRYTIRAAG